MAAGGGVVWRDAEPSAAVAANAATRRAFITSFRLFQAGDVRSQSLDIGVRDLAFECGHFGHAVVGLWILDVGGNPIGALAIPAQVAEVGRAAASEAAHPVAVCAVGGEELLGRREREAACRRR